MASGAAVNHKYGRWRLSRFRSLLAGWKGQVN